MANHVIIVSDQYRRDSLSRLEVDILARSSLLSNHLLVEDFVRACVFAVVERLKCFVSLWIFLNVMNQSNSDAMNVLVVEADIDIRCAHVEDFLLQLVG